MSAHDNSLKQRKKKASKSEILKENSEGLKPKSNNGMAKFGVYLVYVTAFVAVISCLAWLILCKTLCKELPFCNAGSLSSLTGCERSLNGNKTNPTSDSTPLVPKDDTSLWVIERRSNLSLDEFIEKYDGKRLAASFGSHYNVSFLLFSIPVCCFSSLIVNIVNL